MMARNKALRGSKFSYQNSAGNVIKSRQRVASESWEGIACVGWDFPGKCRVQGLAGECLSVCVRTYREENKGCRNIYFLLN